MTHQQIPSAADSTRTGEARSRILPASDFHSLWHRADESLTRTYRICDRVLELRCDDCRYADRFEHAFRHLRIRDDGRKDGVRKLTYLSRHPEFERRGALLDRDECRVRLFEDGDLPPTRLFYYLAFVEEAMFPLTGHAIMHGAVISHRNEVTALLGRTFSGKSTLGLRLALQEEIVFLSDEYCPIRLDDARIEPFPRAIGIRQETRTLLLESTTLPFAHAPNAAAIEEIDPLDIPGVTLGRSGTLRNVVFIAQEQPTARVSSVRQLDLPALNEALLADLRAVPGVRRLTILEKRAGFGHTAQIEVDEGQLIADELTRVCRDRHGLELFGFLPPDARRPDFSKPPTLNAMTPLDGLFQLPRYLVNSKALQVQSASSYSILLDKLSGLIGKARFFWLKPGPLEDTCALVKREVIDS